ncbi:hypothetical protein [uncultured Psychroserpens sp.]|uniref:Spy/CpxP family protein refolding chaperone n=1 Tax=uncultured Psychroserpens sp. TaxID=255436 RepID=UPI002614A947|nr:hypothetical protein [uncultured Psychroserpens sp.]
MKTNKILYILIIFLAVANVFFLVNHLGRYKGKKRVSQSDFIAKELKFDDAQMQKFTVLTDQHEMEMNVISDSLKKFKGKLLNKISEEHVSKNTVDSLLQIIGDYEIQRDEKTFYHFKAIQEICTDQQKKRFNEIVKKALRKKRRRK